MKTTKESHAELVALETRYQDGYADGIAVIVAQLNDAMDRPVEAVAAAKLDREVGCCPKEINDLRERAAQLAVTAADAEVALIAMEELVTELRAELAEEKDNWQNAVDQRNHAEFMAHGWRRLATERANFLRDEARAMIDDLRAYAARWKALAKSLRESAQQARSVAMGFQRFLDNLEGTVAGAKKGTMAYDLWMMLKNRPSKRVN
jgi:hypothetical protein